MLGMHDLVQRLEGDVELVGPHLEAPGVGGDAGDLGVVQPVGGGERQAGGGAAGVVAPAAALGVSRRARVRRPVRTSSRSPRPTRADSPCAAIVASRCSVVIAKPSGSSPSVPMARPTSSSTPRPAIRPPTVSMPVTRSPSLVTTSPARRPFQALPWSKMWPRPSHWVEHCSGMAMTSSAPPMPCGKPWLPRSASVPVSVIVCTGFVRRRQPFCGPSVSKDCDSEKLAPRRTRAAPSRRLASSRKFSVPRTSSAPQRPQFEQRLAAAAMAPSGSLRSSGGMSVTFPTVYGRRCHSGRGDV